MADNSSDSHNLLESIIGLTRQRDQQSLESFLIETMCDLIEATQVALYTLVFAENGATLCLTQFAQARDQANAEEARAKIPSVISLEDAAQTFRLCLEKQDIVAVHESGDRGAHIVYPIFGIGGRLAGMLAVDYPTLSASDHRLISAFLRIYQNYQSLLNESQSDRLTGLLNRKTFDDQISRILTERSATLQRVGDVGEYFLAILDIDHFKRVNDTFGHLYGDEVLLLFARIMKKTFRGEDLLFRFGGEEFVILLKTPDTGACLRALERFRHNVEVFAFPQVGKVTVSTGCVTISGEGLPTTLIDHADQALYYAKNNGRNQVCFYNQLVEEGKLTPVVQDGSVDLFEAAEQ